LLLYSPGTSNNVNEPISGRTRIIKMLYLFKEEALMLFKSGTKVDSSNFYEFFPWHFGPFSKQVYDDINFFIMRRFIKETDSTEEVLPESAAEWEHWLSASSSEDYSIKDYSEETYQLDTRGVEYASNLYGLLSKNQKELLRSFKHKLNEAPLRSILQYVYKTYPDQIDRSIIREEILGD